MATALTVQSWGARGEGPTLVAADANGNEITGNDRPGMILVARNAGAGALTIRIASAAYCSHGINTHYMDVSIPNDSARWPILLGVDDFARKRFGSIVSVTYPGGVTSLTVAAARADNHGGRGNAVASPPSLGSNPTRIVLTAEGEELDVVAATAAGCVLPNTDGRSRLVIHNAGVATRTVYALPMAYCDQGFTDAEVYTVDPGEIRTVERLFPTGRFGYEVGITYDSETGLEFGAVRQGTYAG
jgi:hypothetical protein